MEDLPIGFTMALAENEAALDRFAGLSDEVRTRIIDQARQAASRDEMRAIVLGLM